MTRRWPMPRAKRRRIIAAAKAEIKADLDVAIEKADAEIAAKRAEGEKSHCRDPRRRAGSVKDVAKDTAEELVAAMGGKADARTVTAAVTARMKG